MSEQNELDRLRLEAAIDATGHDAEREPGFALLMLDLDNLKQINDTHGHPVGDAALIAVAERFRRRIGDSDVLARYGGDEFALLTFEADDEETVLALADSLVRSLDDTVAVAGLEVDTSVSVGVAIPPASGETADRLMQRADRALYRAKSRGRNRHAI